MEKNNITPISLIITGVAVIGFAALFISAKKQQDIAVTPAADTTPSSLCYVLNKNGDTAFLKLTTTDGGLTITGDLATYPAQKDSMKGTLSGVATNVDGDAVFDGQYANSAEGMNNISEQLIKLDPTQAQIGYGEMVEAADGTYDYKDKTKVTYSLTLPAVDCTQYDSLKTAAGH
ncbi:MAG: hypothetical protein JWL92_669 [Candidatus Nomurabacteria bacterium]|nr:hypothetical protein [Candidatus Nomurabacteria bacterium]